MNTKDTIGKIIALRDEVQGAINVSEAEVPHLVNAAGHLGSAITHLEAHISKELAGAGTAGTFCAQSPELVPSPRNRVDDPDVLVGA